MSSFTASFKNTHELQKFIDFVDQCQDHVYATCVNTNRRIDCASVIELLSIGANHNPITIELSNENDAQNFCKIFKEV